MTAPEAEAARQTETARTRWLDAAWQAAAVAWIEQGLAQRGLRMTGAADQGHLRPWSTVWSVPTTGGRVWFKAGGPGNRYEAPLLEAVARWRTPRFLEPLAVDVERGWLLLPDGGTRLRETIDGEQALTAWLRVLPEYAALQRELEPRADELVALGIPDLRLASLPDQLAALIEDPGVVLAGEERARLREALPLIATWRDELASIGIAPSLQHDDLHDGNVFVGEAGDRFFDWGDASVAHPFGSLLVAFRSIANRGLGDPHALSGALARLQDAYLEPWTDAHTRSELATAVPLAMRLAIIGRAMSWQRALTGIPPQDHGEWAGNVGGWLMDLFEANLV